MRGLLVRFVADDSGATAIEYSLIGVLISVAIIAAVTAVGGGVQGLFVRISTAAGSAMNSAT